MRQLRKFNRYYKKGSDLIANQANKTAANALRQAAEEQKQYDLGTKIAGDFIAMLDTWHALPEVWDSALDAEIHRQYAEVLTKRQYFDFKSQPYFSPSSANSCKRELYEKLKGAKRDQQERQPHQGRWTRLGTCVGDLIQRDLLFIEKHFEAKTGNTPRFVPERTEDDYPAWEDFVKAMKVIEHNGKKFSLFGTPDGILLYKTDEGEVLRVGLEIKSKQTSAGQTSLYKMREPKKDHVKQVTGYSAMYGVDHYLIVYVNAAKSGWIVDEETATKTPDIRAFYVNVTEEDRAELFDYLTDVLDAVETNTPPKLDLFKFNFNNFKTACALSLSEDEFEDLRQQAKQMLKSNLPQWMKQNHFNAVQFIKEVREKEAGQWRGSFL